MIKPFLNPLCGFFTFLSLIGKHFLYYYIWSLLVLQKQESQLSLPGKICLTLASVRANHSFNILYTEDEIMAKLPR